MKRLFNFQRGKILTFVLEHCIDEHESIKGEVVVVTRGVECTQQGVEEGAEVNIIEKKFIIKDMILCFQ